RTAYTAERHHRVQRDASGRSGGARRKPARSRPRPDSYGRKAPAFSDQRHPRSLEDRRREDGYLRGGYRDREHGGGGGGERSAADREEQESTGAANRAGYRFHDLRRDQGAAGAV